jgi:crotonobetainyl-CoA:carnitine CoA-transferase CaiB-like acyl-CoA transferase
MGTIQGYKEAFWPARSGKKEMDDLQGILVVSLEQAVAAPYASCKLADAGARVIKVEREEGDFARNYDKLVHGQSSYFVWLNRGKESLCLDVKNEADSRLLLDVISKADVFIQNLAPGAVDRLGFGAKTLLEKFPSLICCSLSGYGEDGPYREQKAYDMLVQGESGLISVNGTADSVARVGISVCDITAGMTAYAAIVQSLFARSRTGKGRIIEVSLFHAIADWMNVPYLQTRYGNKPPPRVGVRHPTISPYGAFTCRDGKMVLLSIQNEREWQKLCSDVLGDATLATSAHYASNVLRVKNNFELERTIGTCLKDFTREEAITRLSKAGIACGRLSDMQDLVKHPQLRHTRVQSGGADIDVLAPGAFFPGETQRSRKVPEIGEHSQAIRSQFSKS